MTKTAIIEYNAADEPLLQMFFLKISVQFKDPEPKQKKLSKKSQRLLKEMGEAIEECKAMHRGEIQPTGTVEQLFEEIKQIAADATKKSQTV